MDSQRFLGNIKRQGNKVATFLKTREVVTFLFFLLLAFVLWYMHTTGTQREIKDTLHVQYVGIPDNVRFEQQLPSSVSFVIKDEGQQLWQYRSHEFDTLQIDLSPQFASGLNVEIAYETYLKKLLTQISPTIKMVELTPAYFTTSFVYMESKIVPLVMTNEPVLASQHVLSDSVTVSPRFATVYGSAEAIDTVSALFLEPVLGEFSRTQTLDINIFNPNGFDISVSSASVTVPVEMCTEKEIELPIVLENVPDDRIVRTFPASAKVKFSIGLSRYNSVEASDFCLVFDFRKAVAANSAACALELKAYPSVISNVQVIPSEVEYVIEQN